MPGKTWKQLLTAHAAAEILRAERNSYKAQLKLLQVQLERAEARADRAEERLHQLSTHLVSLSEAAIAAPPRSRAAEVMTDGRSLLKLYNPVG